MVKKIKYGKVLAVVFLTVLIWVWADLAKTEDFSVSNATISIAKSANPNLWVGFNDESSVLINRIVLKGSASKIAYAKRKIRDTEGVLKFTLDPEQEAMTEPEEYSLDVLDFLKKNDRIRQLGLTVESCEPGTVDVQVFKLVKKTLMVKCFDESGTPVKVETIKPPEVDISILEDWGAAAKVQLNPREIRQARASAIKKTPYVELPSGEIKRAHTTVKIKLPLIEETLQPYSITSATLGFTFSANLVGKYDVELLNPADMAMVSVMATPAAKSAYEQQPYKMLLYILDGDEKNKAEQKKQVVYNFPEQFVRNDEIELNQPPAVARFKLILLSPAQTPSGGAE